MDKRELFKKELGELLAKHNAYIELEFRSESDWNIGSPHIVVEFNGESVNDEYVQYEQIDLGSVVDASDLAS